MSEADILAVLKSIDQSLRTLVVIAQKKAESRAAKPGPSVAPDSDLDGQYGDPEVRFNPRDWAGDSQKGKPFSECPAAFLEMLAETLDYFAEKKSQGTEDEKKKAGYDRRDAARARGWALRMRSGKHTPPAGESAPGWAEGY